MGYTLATFNNEVHTMEIFARNPVSCSYVVPPDSCCIEVGACPLNPLPAQYWNYYTREETYTRNYLQKYVADIYTDTRNASRYASVYDCFLTCTFSNCAAASSLAQIFVGVGNVVCGCWNESLNCVDFVCCCTSPWYTQFASFEPVWQYDKGMACSFPALFCCAEPVMLYSSIANSYMCATLADGTNFMCGVMSTVYAQSLVSDFLCEQTYYNTLESLCCVFNAPHCILENMPPTFQHVAVQQMWYTCFNAAMSLLSPLVACYWSRNPVLIETKNIYCCCIHNNSRIMCVQGSAFMYSLCKAGSTYCDYLVVMSNLYVHANKCHTYSGTLFESIQYNFSAYGSFSYSCCCLFGIARASTCSMRVIASTATCTQATVDIQVEFWAAADVACALELAFFTPYVSLYFCNNCR